MTGYHPARAKRRPRYGNTNGAGDRTEQWLQWSGNSIRISATCGMQVCSQRMSKQLQLYNRVWAATGRKSNGAKRRHEDHLAQRLPKPERGHSKHTRIISPNSQPSYTHSIREQKHCNIPTRRQRTGSYGGMVGVGTTQSTVLHIRTTPEKSNKTINSEPIIGRHDMGSRGDYMPQATKADRGHVPRRALL